MLCVYILIRLNSNMMFAVSILLILDMQDIIFTYLVGMLEMVVLSYVK